MTDEERMKMFYEEELQKSGIVDKSIIENLRYMMNMGYLNLTINYNMLKKNNNDLVIAINKLCNNLVSDSMFEQH